jgi:TIGR03009 family protein
VAALVGSVGVSARVSALASGVGRAMTFEKVRVGLLATLTLVVGIGTAAATLSPSRADEPPAGPPLPSVLPKPVFPDAKDAPAPQPKAKSAAPAPAKPADPPLDPAVEKHLSEWEKATAAATNVRTDFTLTRKEAVFHREQKYTGSALCMKSHFVRLRLNAASDPDDYEAYISNGRVFYEYNGLAKTVTEIQLANPKEVGPPPPEEVGPPLPVPPWWQRLIESIAFVIHDHPPLLLLRGTTAAALKIRFDIRLVKDDQYYVYLDLSPRTAAEKAGYERVRVALAKPTANSQLPPYAPAQVWLRRPSGAEEMWSFTGVRRDVPGVEEKHFEYVEIPGFELKRAPARPAKP